MSENLYTQRSRSKFELGFENIHGIINPADIRPNERILAKLKKRSTDAQFEDLRVWRLSPLGVELVYPTESNTYQKGDPVDLEITIAGERTYFEGLIVDVIKQNENIKLMGIRLAKKVTRGSPDTDRRKNTRWLCSDEFYPTCIATSPGRINDYIYFVVRDISKDGLQLICSLRNKHLLAGTSLKLTCNFPMIGDFTVTAKISRIDLATYQGKDKLAIGLKYLNLSLHAKEVIGQYLIQFSNVETLKDLRDSGFTPTSVAKGVDFYYLKTEADFRSTLALRLKAHLYEGTIKKTDIKEIAMGDINDTQARIVVGKYNDRIVATARVRYNDLQTPLEHELYVKWPDNLPRRDQIVEVSRVCTDPDFRQSDLLAGLFQFTCDAGVRTERPWVLIGSWKKLVPFYEKLGFENTGLSHSEPMWTESQTLMIANAPELMMARNVHPLYWNVIWRTPSEHFIENNLLMPDSMDKIRIAIFKLLGPIANRAFRVKRKKSATSA